MFGWKKSPNFSLKYLPIKNKGKQWIQKNVGL